MADQAKPVSRPWRRFLRFSVRRLIVLVLVIGALMGWIVRSARIQREAVAAITEAGGSVMYNWEDRSRNRARHWAPQRIVDLIGIDYFGHVTYVEHYTSSPANDAELAHVGHSRGSMYSSSIDRISPTPGLRVWPAWPSLLR